MEIVIDTNVLVSGLLSPTGKPAAVLEMLLDGMIHAVCDDRVLHEYNTVLRRPQFPFEHHDIDDVLAALTHRAKFALPMHSTVKLPDEKDRCFYECAMQSDSGILVTGNIKHFPARICTAIKVMSPAGFVDWVDLHR